VHEGRALASGGRAVGREGKEGRRKDEAKRKETGGIQQIRGMKEFSVEGSEE